MIILVQKTFRMYSVRKHTIEIISIKTNDYVFYYKDENDIYQNFTGQNKIQLNIKLPRNNETILDLKFCKFLNTFPLFSFTSTSALF